MSSNSKKRKKDIKDRSTICIAGPIFEIYPISAQMESSSHSIKSSRTTAVPVPLKLNCYLPDSDETCTSIESQQEFLQQQYFHIY